MSKPDKKRKKEVNSTGSVSEIDNELTADQHGAALYDVPKVANYVEVTLPQYLPDDFKTFFRMIRGTFERVLERISADDQFRRRIASRGREQVPLDKDLLMTLWYLGNLETVRSIADRFNVSKSTFLDHNRRLLTVLCDSLLKTVICWPSNNDKQTVIDEFQNKKGFPGVLGAIDRTHIKISAPRKSSPDFFNRKEHYSIILQAVCRENRRFTDVYCGWPGKVHAARVFRTSPLFAALPGFTGMNHIIGDEAYPISRYLMPPFSDNGHLSRKQVNFHKALSGTRALIENSFGMLKSRFRRLVFIDMVDIEFIVKK
ncbi:putative nuclease HARBI1 [Dreissena polymorpha]|uniref:putative nuclease HARBI1 n=1 Tax=Dreissena polymorpha TaxID=45954 RepID=UPI002264D4F5|nr:putative nuclease HARBI1 [Dreissena polymorpha]